MLSTGPDPVGLSDIAGTRRRKCPDLGRAHRIGHPVETRPPLPAVRDGGSPAERPDNRAARCTQGKEPAGRPDAAGQPAAHRSRSTADRADRAAAARSASSRERSRLLPDIAFTGRREIKANFRNLIALMLSEEAKRRGFYPAIATHDTDLQDFACAEAAKNGWKPGEYEFEMLLGCAHRRGCVAGSTGRTYPPIPAIRTGLVALCGQPDRRKSGKRTAPGALGLFLSGGRYTSRLCSTAAPMKEANSGCGSNGRDFSSGVKLDAEKPGMVGIFDDLRQDAVRRHAGEGQPDLFQPLAIGGVDLVAVAVALRRSQWSPP